MRLNRTVRCLLIAGSFASINACRNHPVSPGQFTILPPQPEPRRATPVNSPAVQRMMESAQDQTATTCYYNPSYAKLDYPGGDVPLETGVCSDVVVRAFRAAGVDLQRELHEHMTRAFSSYPRKWGHAKPDANIDHRRVPNLSTYFERKGKALAVSTNPQDYLPGDVVSWDLGGGTTHIGLVTNALSDATGNHLVVHNIGAGARIEDVLFQWQITGHYRYFAQP